jgi:sugar/nucleoside kinase (ribokinase family)
VPCVVVKLGGDGALVARRGTEPAPVPAFPATVADATGAGDSFYSEGVLRGAVITLSKKKGVRGYQLVAG